MTVWHDTYQEPGREAAVGPATLEPAGLDLSFFASLAVHLGSLAESFKREQDRRDEMVPPQDSNLVGQGVVNAAGQLVIDLGSVPEGRVWQVRRIVIGEPTATAAPTGSAFLLAQGAPPVAGNVPTTSVVDSWPTFAKGAAGSTYGTHQLFLIAPEHLWVVVHGGTSGVQWVTSCRVEDFDADTYYRAAAQLSE